MKHSRAAAAGLAAIAIGILSYRYAARQRCQLEPGKVIAYQVEVAQTTRVLPTPSDRHANGAASEGFAGKLLIAVEADAALSARFVPRPAAEGQPEMSSFASSVSLALDPACRITSLSFDGRQPFSARSFLQRVFGILDLGRAAMGPEPAQDDEFGRFAYAVEGGKDHLELARGAQLAGDKPLPATAPHIVTVGASKLSYDGLGDGPWHERIAVSERLTGIMP